MIKGDEFINKTTAMPYELAVSMGRVPGYSSISKFGVNQSITIAEGKVDIWEFGGGYTYDDDGTEPIAYISSSSALDTGQTISITGLNALGETVVQDVITDGQSNVSLDTPLWRVYRMTNNSDYGLDINGMLYCHTDASPTSGVPLDANVRAIIDDGNNQTLMAIYTVPKGKVGFLTHGEAGIQLEGNASSLAEYSVIQYETRAYGKLFKVQKVVNCLVGGGSLYQNKRAFPDPIPALTDLKVSSAEVTQTMGIFATFDVLLVDEDKLEKSYLAAIGQPGY